MKESERTGLKTRSDNHLKGVIERGFREFNGFHLKFSYLVSALVRVGYRNHSSPFMRGSQASQFETDRVGDCSDACLRLFSCNADNQIIADLLYRLYSCSLACSNPNNGPLTLPHFYSGWAPFPLESSGVGSHFWPTVWLIKPV